MPSYADRIDSISRWTIKDYQSTTVTLFNEDYAHLIEGHQIFKKNESAIKESIQDPKSVYIDTRHANRRLYVGDAPATYVSKLPYTKVVLEGADPAWTDARVVTAYPDKKEEGSNAQLIYKRSQG